MGGAIAQELALRHPDLVSTLVLHGTWCVSDRHFQEEVRGWQMLANAAPTPHDFFVAVNVWFLAPRIYDEGTIDDWAADADDNPHAQSVDAFCRSAEALLTHDTQDRLHRIECPTLVTVGSLDICTPPRRAQQLVDLIQGAELYVFEGGSHAICRGPAGVHRGGAGVPAQQVTFQSGFAWTPAGVRRERQMGQTVSGTCRGHARSRWAVVCNLNQGVTSHAVHNHRRFRRLGRPRRRPSTRPR